MKLKWNGKNSICGILAFVMFIFCLSGCDDSPAHPGEGFYSYNGYRDWWRFPLKFPFHIIILETFDFGRIKKYDPSQNIADPNVSSSSIMNDAVTLISLSEAYVAFRCEKGQFGILVYQSESVAFFESEADLQKYLIETFPEESTLKFYSLRQSYDDIWKSLSSQSGQ